jgi:hypothetical protein
MSKEDMYGMPGRRWARNVVGFIVDKVKMMNQRSNEAVKMQNEDMKQGVKFNRYESTSDTLKRHGSK